jgi:hypothetical protein
MPVLGVAATSSIGRSVGTFVRIRTLATGGCRPGGLRPNPIVHRRKNRPGAYSLPKPTGLLRPFPNCWQVVRATVCRVRRCRGRDETVEAAAAAAAAAGAGGKQKLDVRRARTCVITIKPTDAGDWLPRMLRCPMKLSTFCLSVPMFRCVHDVSGRQTNESLDHVMRFIRP